MDVFRGSGDRVSPGAWTIEAVRGFGQSRQSEGLDNRGSPRVWTLAEFQRVFPDEASCAALLIARRSLEGSPALLVATLAPSPCRAAHACSNGSTAGDTDDAGTAMHRSKLPLATWFWAAHLIAMHSNGMSARQLADQLGVTYKSAWLLTQKLRRGMAANRDLLEGVVDVGKMRSRVGSATRSSSPARLENCGL